MPLIISILFIVGYFLLVSGIFCIKKSEKMQLAISWLLISIMLGMAYNALIAGIMNWIHIPIENLSLGIVDMLSGGCIWYVIFRSKQRQKYQWRIGDIAVICIGGIFMGILCVTHFPELNPNFQAIDAPHHLQAVESIVFQKNITSTMYYSDLYGALVVGIFSPIYDVANYYKAFVLSEIFNFFMAGWSLYAVFASKIKKKSHFVVATILMLLYTFGYPLSNLLYGFVYWGMSITVISGILCLFRYLSDNECQEHMMYFGLMLLNYALFESYVLFIPPVFLAELLFYIYLNKEKVITKKNILNCLFMFLPAVVIGMIYSGTLIGNAGIFIGGSGTTSEAVAAAPTGISLEGGIYKDLYRDFLLFLPFSLSAFFYRLRKKQWSCENVLWIITVIYMVMMFIGGVNGKVSSYYYCKNNYLMWLLLICMAFDGIIILWEKQKELILSYGLILSVLTVLFFSSAETKLVEKNSNFDFGTVQDCAKIYADNRQMMEYSEYSSLYIKAYKDIYENYVKKGSRVAISSEFWLHETWFNVVTHQEFTVCQSDYNRYLTECEPNADYILVFNDSFYQNDTQHFDQYEKIMDYGFGFLVKK